MRVTDLHQGIVWGTQTEETRLDERLINRFDYDGDYGTVLNRFLMQAAIGYPLTVHGTGGQTRAFIHIQDTVRCIELAIENPPQTGERVQHPQPDDRDATACATWPKKIADMTGARDRLRREPAQRGGRKRTARRQRPLPRPRPRADHARRRPARRRSRDRQEIRRPVRQDQDPLRLKVEVSEEIAPPNGHKHFHFDRP